MANLNTIIDALGTRLETIANVNVSTEHPDRIAPPHLVIGLPEQIDYHETMSQATGQLMRVRIPIFMYVSRADALDGQRTLKAMLSTEGALSVHNTLSAGDLTYGSVIESLMVLRGTRIGRYTISGVNYLGAEFETEVVFRA